MEGSLREAGETTLAEAWCCLSMTGQYFTHMYICMMSEGCNACIQEVSGRRMPPLSALVLDMP